MRFVISGLYMLYFFGSLYVNFIKANSRVITICFAYFLTFFQIYLSVVNQYHGSFIGGYILLAMLVILYIRGYRQVLIYSVLTWVMLIGMYFLSQGGKYPMKYSAIISMGITNLLFTMLKVYILNKDFRIMQYSKQLVNKERQYRNLLESAPDAIISVDSEGNITGMNKRGTELFLYTEQELIGKKIEILIPKRFRHEHVSNRGSYKENPKTREMGADRELYAINKNGEEFPVEISLSPVIDSENKTVIAIIRDISKRLQAEKELNEIKLKLQEKELAEKVSIAKSEFISKMSHEIRTPLNGIYGFTNILLKEDIAPEHKKFIENIKFSSELLNVLINDILDNTNLETGNITLENNEIDIRRLTENVLESFRTRLADKNIRTEINYSETIPNNEIVAVGDFLRISQIIMNLLSNAIKFSYEGGKIEIDTSLTELSDTKLQFSYAITDYGIGIPEEKLRDIFQPFVQVSSEISKKYGGNGLGLSIVKHLIDKMDGEVSAASNGKTVFSFRIPLQKAVHKDNIPSVEIVDYDLNKDLKIMVVEDNLMNQFLIKTILEKKGIKHDIVENGKQALLQLENDSYDIILMDLMMPEMDGISCARFIRKDLGADVKIIALTADVKASVNPEIDELFDGYIKKPFDEAELMLYIYAFNQRAEQNKIND
ncbi:MAG: sensor hybrid histidine kinase [Crocinitomicaceae bacterium]|nr:sensor hybrid histidine kinase [Crocinitomicaceae bacterium]